MGKQEKKRSWATHAEGTAALSGLDELELRSDKELVLTVGKSSIRISAEKIDRGARADPGSDRALSRPPGDTPGRSRGQRGTRESEIS